MSERERTFTTSEVARICGVYPTTVIGWIKQGRIKAFATPGGHRRVLQGELRGFLERFGMPVPEQLRGGRRRVLIVEDEKDVGEMLRKALTARIPDAEIEWTQDGIGALLALGQRPPDLLVLDVVLPVVDGARVLASLRADPRTREIKVIGVTGKRLDPEKLKFMKRHTHAFFLKPFDVAAFADKALALLDAARRAE